MKKRILSIMLVVCMMFTMLPSAVFADGSSTPTAPSITTTSLPDGVVDTAYNETLTATGAAITWSVTDGSLPQGLSLDTSTGAITGTPTAAGTSEFTVKASNGTEPDATKVLSINIVGISTEQFSLATGETYYFDLSGYCDLSGEKENSGTINSAVPDETLHYVPFTYTGTVNAYSYPWSDTFQGSERSLFVADYNIINSVRWDMLNKYGLIYGKTFDTNYKLRSLSGGWGASEDNIIRNNEWDSILDKSELTNPIKNWSGQFSYTQDCYGVNYNFDCAIRGNYSDDKWSFVNTNNNGDFLGFRPALEVLDPATLGSDGLKAVTLNLNGGSFDTNGPVADGVKDSIKIVCAGGSFKAPSATGLTRPSGNTDTGFHWKGSDNKPYAVGDSVPNSVTSLTAQWVEVPTVKSWEELKTEIGKVAEDTAATIIIGGNFNTSTAEYAPIRIDNRKRITLQSVSGQNYTITRAAGNRGTFFGLSGGGELTLQNITLDGGGASISPRPYASMISSISDGTVPKLVLGDGAVLQNNQIDPNETANGGSVEFEGGTITMNDGSAVKNNFSPMNGGGIYLLNSTLTMNGGSINGNSSSGNFGTGGVAVNGNVGTSIFNMNGGTISGNSSSGMRGVGGVSIYMSSQFHLSGGTITGNTSEKFVGGVFLGKSIPQSGENFPDPGTMTIEGNPVISGNTVGSGVGSDLYIEGPEEASSEVKPAILQKAGALTSGASVGIFIYYGLRSTILASPEGGVAVVEGDKAYFFSNDETKGTIDFQSSPAALVANVKTVPKTAPSITTTSLPNGVVGTAYSQTLAATGTRPITWSITSGGLPAGLSFDKDTGAIIGTPTAAGKCEFTVKAENSVGSDTKALSINIQTTTPTPDGTIWNGTSSQYFAGGTGIKDDPYQIATAEQLCLLSAVINQYDYSSKSTATSYGSGDRKVVADQDAQTYAYLQTAYYKLTADIVLNDTADWESWNKDTTGLNEWKPIGCTRQVINKQLYSCVHFDGGNHTVSGLYFSDATESGWNGTSGGEYVGLFGWAYDGKIENVKLADSYIYGDTSVGGIAGQCAGITNCQNSGTITGTGSYVGGIAGRIYAPFNEKIENCKNSGIITGTASVGGIIGAIQPKQYYSVDHIITHCENSGKVTGTGIFPTDHDYSRVGGIVGQDTYTTIVDCKNTGAVTGFSAVAGIAGSTLRYNDESISNKADSISTCQNSGMITGISNVGGIAGMTAGDTVTDCQNSGEIKRMSGQIPYFGGIGGIVGYADWYYPTTDYSIKGCTNTGKINVTCSGTTIEKYVNAGGIVGCFKAFSPVINCQNSGAITVTNTAESCIYNVGGIVGYNVLPRIITDCQNSGAITANGLVCAIGGIIGENNGAGILKNSSSPKGLVPNATGDIGEDQKPTSTSFYLGHIVGKGGYGGGTGNSSDGSVSSITSVSVSPATATVKKTKTQQFTADVSGIATDKSVTWSVTGGSKSSIDSNGLLTVGGMETAATLTVKATSKVDSSKFGTATVTVTSAPKISTVTFDSDGGSAVDPISGIEEGKTIKLPNVPTKDSCRFDGWYTAKNGGGTQFTSGTTVTYSITVYAKWTKLVTVSGIVVNEKDETPILAASITLNPANGTTAFTTDADGKFTFSNVPEDMFTATATFTDGSSVTVNVTGDYENVKIVKPKPYIAITTQPQDAIIIKGIEGQSATFNVLGTRTPHIADSIAYEWWWLKGATPAGMTPDEKMTGSGSQMTLNQDNGNIPGRGTYKLYAYAYDADAAIDAYSRIATLKVVGVNTIEGVVKNADNTPVNGAKVELVYAGGTWPYGSVAMTTSTNAQTTGADGAYKFETVPDGKYKLVITLPGGGHIMVGPNDFPKIDPDAPINIVVPEKASIQISGQPQDATVKNGTAVTLSVDAASTDGTVLTYQWYSNTKNSNTGGTKVEGAASASYTPATANKGTTYYYCVVAGGSLDAVTTRAAKITVNTYGIIAGTVQTRDKQPIEGATVELINIDTPVKTGFTTSTNPQTTVADGKYKFIEVPDGQYKLKITLPGGEIFVVQPINVPNVTPDIPVTPPDKPTISISSQPKSMTVALHDTAEITVNAGISTGGTVLYQWYSNTANNTTGGTAIDGATAATYRASTNAKGITYYYCLVQSTGADAVTSNIAKLTVRNTPVNNLMTIEGNVVDDQTPAQPVEGAVVTLSPKAGTSGNPQTTGLSGHYRFENLSDGKYIITVKLPGGGVIEKEIVIEDGEITPTPPNDIPAPTENSITFSQQPTDIEVTTEMDATFTAKATATKADVNYQWYKNTTNASSGGTKLDGKTAATLTLDKQTEGVSYYYCVVSSTGATDKATTAAKLTVTKAGGNKGDLEGGIVNDDDGKPVADASVKLMKKGTDGTQFGSTVTTGEDGKFAFTAIPYGSYSLVAEKDAQIITRQIAIKSANTIENLTLPSGGKLTKVIIQGSSTPSVAIGNLEEMFTTADNTIARQAGAQIEIKLVVQQTDAPANKAQIDSALAQNQKVGVYLDAALVKTISGTAADDTTESIQPPDGQTLRIVLDIPGELQGKTGYKVIRAHNENGVTDTRIIDPDYDSALQTLSFDADAFSTYAVVYTDSGNNNNNNNNNNGGSSSYSYYTITASASEGGSISPSGSVSVGAGQSKTFTLTPSSGYIISDLIIDGKSAGVKNSYTFDNVSANHSIRAEFKIAENSNPSTDVYFEDVNENDWFYKAVVDVVENGWFKGTSDTLFSPNLSTERGMIVTVLWNMEGQPKPVNPSIFKDVPAEAWFHDGVTWANENNEIVKGYGNGLFGPKDKITREQLTSILYRYAAFKGYDLSGKTGLDGFKDGNKTSNYAVKAMQWAVANGLLTGKGNKILDPRGYATRAEAAVILSKFGKLFIEK